jgi:hypothetical protein
MPWDARFDRPIKCNRNFPYTLSPAFCRMTFVSGRSWPVQAVAVLLGKKDRSMGRPNFGRRAGITDNPVHSSSVAASLCFAIAKQIKKESRPPFRRTEMAPLINRFCATWLP